MLPGGRDPKVYNTYRTEAVLLRARPSECVLPSKANLECARLPVLPNRPQPKKEPAPEARMCPDDSSQP
eukprot:1957233-Pleurochrysis_carterae.AAC.1